jgi:chromosome segregation ATPase
LGGNCKTTMMAMVSPAFDSFSESLSTLKFATRAKKIKNEAKINEDVDQRALLRKYEQELKKLRSELEERNKQVVDKGEILRLEQQKRRAEEDKMAAITALEARSREYMMEKEEKKKLEEKIKMLNSQLLIGGKKVEDTPQFKTALEEKQRIIRQEYEGKLSELERERQQIEEDKAQVDRYKQLLLKQRDIMIALTARLNERDETIIQLQEELDAYERIHRDTETLVDKKQDRIIALEHIMHSKDIEVPPDDGFNGASQSQAEKKYTPHETYHIEGDNDDLPL